MKKFLPVFLAVMLICGNCFAASTDIGLEALFNRVFDSTNNGIKAVISGEAEALTKATITSTSTTESAFTIDVNATTGTTATPAFRLDSEQTDTAAIYITSAVDATGTSSIFDDYAVVVHAEGLGGALNLYSAKNNRTGSLLKVHDAQTNNSSASGITLEVINAGDVDGAADAVVFSTTGVAFNENTVFINRDTTTGATGKSALRIDSEDPDSAAVYITSANDRTGTSTIFDDYAFVVQNEGIGGVANFYRDVDAADGVVVKIFDNHADSTGATLLTVCDQDATATQASVQFSTTESNYDQPVIKVTQAGVTSTNFKQYITLDGNTIYVSDGAEPEGNLTGVQGDLCLNAGGDGRLAFCDANGTNWTDL